MVCPGFCDAGCGSVGPRVRLLLRVSSLSGSVMTEGHQAAAVATGIPGQPLLFSSVPITTFVSDR